MDFRGWWRYADYSTYIEQKCYNRVSLLLDRIGLVAPNCVVKKGGDLSKTGRINSHEGSTIPTLGTPKCKSNS